MNLTRARHRNPTKVHAVSLVGVTVIASAAGLIGAAQNSGAAGTAASYEFGPGATTTVSGYSLDTGAAYSAAAGHGWLTSAGSQLDLRWATRKRSGVTGLQSTLIQAGKQGAGVTWRNDVPNGQYTVTVGVGDPSYTDSIDNVTINGTTFVNKFAPTSSNHFTTATATITVTNGILLLSTVGGTNTKLDYVKVATPAGQSTPPDDSVPTHLAWMYSNPANASDIPSVVDNFDTFILGSSQTALINAVHAAKPTAPLYQYFLLDQIIKPPAGQKEFHNNAAYNPGDFNNIWTNHQDWFLRDSNGNVVTNGSYYRMDPGNTAWRAFWTSRVATANAGWNGGVFADNTDIAECGLDHEGRTIPEYPNDDSYTDAIAGFLKYAYTTYFQPNGKGLTLNLTNGCTGRDESAKYVPYSTVAFHEGWGVDWHTGYLGVNTWNAQLQDIQNVTAAGKGAILVSQGAQYDYQRQQFAFGSYLLIETPQVSFRYSMYENNAYDYPWLYSDYQAKLGTPTGARFQQSDGSWRRNFTNGYVSVNPTTHASSIVVNS